MKRGTAPVEPPDARLPGFVVEQSEDVGVVAGGTAEVRFELVPAPVAIDQIIVTPSHFAMLKNEPESRQFLSRNEVRRLPHMADAVQRCHRAVGATQRLLVTARCGGASTCRPSGRGRSADR